MKLNEQSIHNIVDFLHSLLNEWDIARGDLEDTWHDAWANFISSPQALAWLQRNENYKFINKSSDSEDEECDTEADWHHKVPTGKGFEIADTLWAYLMQATFSNEQWFTVVLDDQEEADEANVLRQAIAEELDESDFQLFYGDWLRQICVTGSSAMRVSWCSDKCRLRFEAVSNYRIYPDPTTPAQDADLFVATFTTRRALKRMIGKYNMLDEEILMELTDALKSVEETDMDTDRSFSGVSNVQASTPQGNDRLTIYEYYGTVYDDMDYLGSKCKAIICGNHLIHFETECTNPIVFGTFISLLEQSWGMSPTTASAGLLAADRIFLNSRLDNLASSSTDAYTYREDGVLDPDFKVYPGALIRVLDQDAIRPLARGSNNLGLTYQEEAALQYRININTALTPGVGSGQQRKAERVTAQEIIAAKQVGGTRLNQYHMNIERRSTNKMLALCYYMLGKYGTTERKFEYKTDDATYILGYVPRESCKKRAKFRLRGSQAVLEANNELTRTIEFAQFAASIMQQMQAATQAPMEVSVNWSYILERAAYLWGVADPSKLIKKLANESQELTTPESTVPTASQQAVLESNLAVDGGATLANQAYSDMRLR